MIRYTLKCAQGHDFDGWFASAAAFDKLHAAGMVTCSVCGSAKVEKALMAPAVRAEERPLSAPDPRAEALAALRRAVEENSDYVGMNFAAEARAIHDGTAPERAIYGEARLDEARALIEDGIPVAPLPFAGPRKTN
ncbi:DUF1178 family protein [Paenirhodobacter sp.]|uniref:DUF1178 family protein n=1 Tax=Paenirhodobacter sp. TaxID=1965326 RepID=UPI003B3E68A0